MTERDEPYTPSLDEVREAYADGVWRSDHYMAVGRVEFDRWLAAHDEAVRQEERDRIAKELRAKFGVTNRAASWIREQGKEQA